MDFPSNFIVRAADLGFRNTKYVSSIVGSDICCASFPSIAYPSRREPSTHIGQQAVASMLHWIGALYGFQNIILVGGAAYLFKKAIKEAFPKHNILEVKDPLYANVRGFQIAGMNYAQKLIAAQAAATQGGA